MLRYCLTLAVLLCFAAPALAQLNPLGNMGGRDQPLELESDKGLELHQDRQMVVARGNVIVRQDDVRLRADIVSASYKDIDGRRNIYRVDALGDVVITTGKERLTGEHATYDLEQELFLMQGRNLKIEAENQTVTAEESLEYWAREKRAVARGGATAVQNSDNTRLRADVIQAQLAPRDDAVPTAEAGEGMENLALNLIQAWGHVVIRTENEIVEGDKGTYDAIDRVATLEGNVVITRGKNQLQGAKAIVNLDSGVSRLAAAPGERVRSVFYPGADAESEAEAPASAGSNGSEGQPAKPEPEEARGPADNKPAVSVPAADGAAETESETAKPAQAGDRPAAGTPDNDNEPGTGTPASQVRPVTERAPEPTIVPRPRPEKRR